MRADPHKRPMRTLLTPRRIMIWLAETDILRLQLEFLRISVAASHTFLAAEAFKRAMPNPITRSGQ